MFVPYECEVSLTAVIPVSLTGITGINLANWFSSFHLSFHFLKNSLNFTK